MKHNSKLNRSRWLLLTLFTLLVGISPAWGETLTETFDAITVTSRYVLSNGWVMVHNGGSYQGFGGSYDYQLKSGNYDGNTGTSLYCSYSDTNEYVVIPTKLSGTFTYYAKRAESYNGTITFYEATEEGGVFTVTNTQLATTSTTSSWGSQKSFELGNDGKYVAFQLIESRIDQISATIYEAASGPAFIVKDGSTKLSSPYAFNFGLATAGTTKTFTLSNPGTAAVEGLSVSETGSFDATLSATSIAAGGQTTLTITMPSTTGSSTITISSTTEGIDDFVINASGTLRDPNKVYLNFSDSQIPDGWTSVRTGSYGEAWTPTSGYIYQSGSSSSYSWAFSSPKLVFAKDEVIMFKTARHLNKDYYDNPRTCSIVVEYSLDGSSFTPIGSAFTDDAYNEWTQRSVTIPVEGVNYIRFNGYDIRLTEIYGGQLPLNPTPKDLAYSNVTNASAQLSWTSTASNFNIQYKTTSAGEWTTIENITANPYTLTGLDAETEYQVKVQADHGVYGLSDYTDPISFTTKTNPISAYPYTENFNSLSSNGQIPSYWDNSEGTTEGTYKWSYNSSYGTGHEGKCIRFDSYSNNTGRTNFLKTRPFIFTEGTPMRLTFWYKNPTGGDFSVYASTDGGTTYPIELATGLTGKSDWTQKEINIPASVYGNNVVIVFKGTSNFGSGDARIYLDDVEISEVSNYSMSISGGDISENTIAFGTVKNTTTTKTFTINNDGGDVLTGISVVSSDNTVFTVSDTGFDLASGASKDITVTFVKATEADYSETITISQTNVSPVVLTATATYVAPTPATIAVKLNNVPVGASVPFGTVGKAKTKTFTVSNTGEATLNITSIESSNTTDFAVSPASLDVAGGETGEFTVTFVWDGEALNVEKTADITLTNNAGDPVEFTVTGTRDNFWSEDFSANSLPDGWEDAAGAWTFAGDGVAVGSYNNGKYLFTPSLLVEEGKSMTFEAKKTGGFVDLIVYYSKNNGDYVQYTGLADLTTEYQTYTISGLDAGTYKFRINDEAVYLKNFEGFKLNTDAPAFGYYTNSQCTEAAAATVTRNYGFVTEAPKAVVYYMKNDGTGTLNLTLGDVPIGFTAVLGKASLAADESTTLTINMPIATKGYRGGDIVVTGKDSGDNTLGTFTVTASGVVIDEDKLYLDFTQNSTELPVAWTNKWEKNNAGYPRAGYTKETMETTKLVAEANEKIVIVAKNESNGYVFGLNYKAVGDENWTELIAEQYIGTDWNMLTATIPDAGNYLLQFVGSAAQIQRIYGLAMPQEPVMVVYDGENVAGATKNFGMVSDEADAVWTLTVKNEGQAKLEGLTAALSGEQAAHYSAEITGATGDGNDEIEAGAKATITVKQLKENLGAHEAILTISATGLDSKVIALSGSTRDHTLLYVDFDGSNDWPAAIASHGANWEVYAGYARQNSATASSLVLAPLTISDASDALRFKVSRVDTNRDLTVRYTTNGGVTWNDYNFGTNETPVTSLKDQITSTSSYNDFEITNIPAGTVAFDFYGKSIKLDNITADYSLASAPLVAFTKVTDNISDANLTADAEATYTLANIGNADYVGTVAKSNVNVAISGEGVTYEGNTLTILAGKTAEITVTMPFAAPYGAKNGSMTITSNSWVGDVAENYTANLIDPDAINIDFNDKTKPEGWYNSGWSFANSAAQNGLSGESTLITQKLAVAGTEDVLTYDARAYNISWYTPVLNVSYSTDRKNWTDVAVQPTNLTNDYQTFNVSGLAQGEYYLKFTGSRIYVDNISGWHKVTGIEHDLYVSATTFPATTLIPETIDGVNATATVYSLRANETGVYAKLFFDETEVATAEAQNISKDGSANFTLTGNVPATEKTYAAKIVVYYSDESVAFETLTTNVEVAHTRTLSITEFTRDGEGEIDANASNQFSAAFNVMVQNTGSIAATPVVKIFIGETEVGTATADAAVAAGKSKEIAVNVTNASAGEGGELAFTAKAYWTAEGEVKATSASDVVITVNAAAPKFALYQDATPVNNGDDVEFGLVKGTTKTYSYTIKNEGTADLVLKSIEAPDGFTATTVTDENKTIAPNGTLDIDVTLNAEQGKKSGNLVFTYKVDAMTNNTFTLALSGRSVAADTWTEAFDDYQASIPANWTNNKWSIAGEYNDYPGAVYSYNDDATLISPRLTAEAGEELTFDVKNNYYNTATYAIFSASSNTWSDEETISGTGEITFTAPAAGDYYLRLTGRGAYIQNFVGFKLATTVPVTISQYGYTTFASMSNINADELPDDIEVFYVKSEGVGGSYVRLTKAEGNIPAGTGLVLKGTADEEYNLSIATGATTALEGNLMVGCLEATLLDADASRYVLINNTDEGRAEFQSLAEYGITILAGKAYLKVPGAGAGARLMIFDDGETTGISSVLRQQARDGRVYNLNGQRVENPKKGQLYIINGKQTVVK